MARTEPGDVKQQLPARPPDNPEPFADIIRDLDTIIVPGLSHWQHPQFFGYFPCNGTLASVLGDYVSTGLGVLGLAWQSSPALTELEEVVTDWMRGMLGLSDCVERRDPGHRVDQHADRADLRARADHRLTARTAAAFRREPQPLIVYTSAHSHSSVDKAALLAGFGRANVRVVAHDEHYAMRPDALAEAIAADLPRRREAVRDRRDLRQHGVDGARSDRRHRDARRAAQPVAARRRRDGRFRDGPARMPLDVERRRRRRLARRQPAQVAGRGVRLHLVLRARPGASGPRDVHQPELSADRPPTAGSRTCATGASRSGRRFRALKLWFLIREQGVAGLQARLRRDLDNAQWLAGAIAAAPRLAACSRRCRCRRVCVRHEPAGLDGDALDRHTQAWCDRVNRSGAAYLTPAVLDGRWMVRVSIGAEQTERAHVEALWNTMQTEAER